MAAQGAVDMRLRVRADGEAFIYCVLSVCWYYPTGTAMRRRARAAPSSCTTARVCAPSPVPTATTRWSWTGLRRRTPCSQAWCSFDAGQAVRYTTLNGAGVPKRYIAVNGTVPGPPINANENDWLQITVINNLDIVRFKLMMPSTC